MIKEGKTGSKIGGNRLKREKSPYLLQHADNPVDWYPWGDAAFEKAKKEDKPIFLSIGYSTCHWCHVMAHESFEDPEVAGLLNAVFVSVKVDREERPDVDGAYMTAAQIMTGGGGWPLTIIMTPDKKPFFAATYIPKISRYGRVGMMDLIPRVDHLWKNQREKALGTAEELTGQLKKISAPSSGETLGKEILTGAARQLSGLFDPLHGGFSHAPKFPTPHNLLFLLRFWKRSNDRTSLSMVAKTLLEMRKGGLFDQVGSGFHRYSTDENWLVPHFEKMLYDQAMLVMAYSEAYQATKMDEFKVTAQEVLTYVLRDMQSRDAGFYSAEDADSEGVEGKFYVWSEGEIRNVLSKEEFELAKAVFNVREEGNFLDEATRESSGENILHLKKTLPEISKELDVPLKQLKLQLEKIRGKLFKAREKRVHPGRDDKILTDWNGLMIAALAIAARELKEKKYSEAAKGAADFILSKMLASNGRLLHRYKDGEAGITGFLEDYAFLVWGLIELYESTFDPSYLGYGVELTNQMIANFWDPEDGGFFHTPDDGEELLIRKKEFYDGATPSGNSVALLNLLRLARLTANNEFENRAVELIKAFSSTVSKSPAAYSHFMSGVDFLLGPSHEVVIVGGENNEDTLEMVEALRDEFMPNKVVLFKSIVDEKPGITSVAEFTRDYKAIDGQATAYVCSNYVCKKPTTDAEEMMRLLRKN
jgi:uncharacterized protein YyaL (SSP411 family)